MQRSLQQLTRPVLRATTKNVRTSSHKQMRRNFASGPDPNVMVRDLFGLGKRVNNDVFSSAEPFIQYKRLTHLIFCTLTACWGAPAGAALLWVLFPARARLLPSVFGEDEEN